MKNLCTLVYYIIYKLRVYTHFMLIFMRFGVYRMNINALGRMKVPQTLRQS